MEELKTELGVFVVAGFDVKLCTGAAAAPSLSVLLPPPAFLGVPDLHVTWTFSSRPAHPAARGGLAGGEARLLPRHAGRIPPARLPAGSHGPAPAAAAGRADAPAAGTATLTLSEPR